MYWGSSKKLGITEIFFRSVLGALHITNSKNRNRQFLGTLRSNTPRDVGGQHFIGSKEVSVRLGGLVGVPKVGMSLTVGVRR